MIRLLFQLFSLWMRAWRCYIGVNPHTVSGNAIIFFPHRPACLYCGLAGLLAVKRDAITNDTSPSVAAILTHWQEMERCGLASLMDGSTPLSTYLGGEAALKMLTQSIWNMKERDTFRRIFTSNQHREIIQGLANRIRQTLAQEEQLLNQHATAFVTSDLEVINSRLITLKDIAWELERDLLGNLDRITALAGGHALGDLGAESLENYRTLNLLLNALDRLEVRGRDSAGVQMSFAIPTSTLWEEIERELHHRNLTEAFLERAHQGELRNRMISVSSSCNQVTFIFKTYSVIGELGRNVGELRREIAGDEIFHLFCQRNIPGTLALVHTRWASVGP